MNVCWAKNLNNMAKLKMCRGEGRHHTERVFSMNIAGIGLLDLKKCAGDPENRSVQRYWRSEKQKTPEEGAWRWDLDHTSHFIPGYLPHRQHSSEVFGMRHVNWGACILSLISGKYTRQTHSRGYIPIPNKPLKGIAIAESRKVYLGGLTKTTPREFPS